MTANADRQTTQPAGLDAENADGHGISWTSTQSQSHRDERIP
jgi:hypothetical protein